MRGGGRSAHMARRSSMGEMLIAAAKTGEDTAARCRVAADLNFGLDKRAAALIANKMQANVVTSGDVIDAVGMRWVQVSSLEVGGRSMVCARD